MPEGNQTDVDIRHEENPEYGGKEAEQRQAALDPVGDINLCILNSLFFRRAVKVLTPMPPRSAFTCARLVSQMDSTKMERYDFEYPSAL